MAEEYLAYPGEHFPDEVYPFAATAVDDATKRVHSPKGWEWVRVSEAFIPDHAALIPDLIGATQETILATDVPLSNITIAGGHENVNTAVVKEIWSKVVTAREGVFEKITADMIAANSITADMIQAGAIDGQVITGATIQTNKSGAKVVLDRAGLRVYNNQGEATLNARANGDIEITGHIGRRDTWSNCYFTDLVSEDTRRDDDDLWLHGVGLSFDSERFAKNGSLSIVYDRKNNTGGVQLSSPAVGQNSQRAIFRMTESRISMFNGIMNFLMSRDSIFFGSNNNRYTFRFDNDGIMYTHNGNVDFHSTNTGFSIGMGKGKSNVWGNSTQAVLGVSPHRYLSVFKDAKWGIQVMGTGFLVTGDSHTNGSKNFIMPVPGKTLTKDDDHLVHRCTESPWDGVEYWGTVKLDAKGEGSYSLPSYFRDIARDDVPPVALCSGQEGPASARISGSTVAVKGDPGDTVSVLVKAARHVWKLDDDNEIIEGSSASADPEDVWDKLEVGPAPDFSDDPDLFYPAGWGPGEAEVESPHE